MRWRVFFCAENPSYISVTHLFYLQNQAKTVWVKDDTACSMQSDPGLHCPLNATTFRIGVLSHYHTMSHFNALKIYSCGKH